MTFFGDANRIGKPPAIALGSRRPLWNGNYDALRVLTTVTGVRPSIGAVSFGGRDEALDPDGRDLLAGDQRPGPRGKSDPAEQRSFSARRSARASSSAGPLGVHAIRRRDDPRHVAFCRDLHIRLGSGIDDSCRHRADGSPTGPGRDTAPGTRSPLRMGPRPLVMERHAVCVEPRPLRHTANHSRALDTGILATKSNRLGLDRGQLELKRPRK